MDFLLTPPPPLLVHVVVECPLRAAIDFQMHGLEIVKCREAMRLFPVAPFLTRIQQKSLDIDGFEILQWEILKELENYFFILFLSNILRA